MGRSGRIRTGLTTAYFECGQYAVKQDRWLRLHRFRENNQLHDVQAPFAALNLGDEGLRLAELVGHILLSHARSLPRLDKDADQCGILRRMQAFGHGFRFRKLDR